MHQCLQLTIDPPKEVRTFLGSFTKSKHQLVEIRIFIFEVRNIFPFRPPFSWPWYCGGGVFTSGTGSTWKFEANGKANEANEHGRVLQFGNDDFQSSRVCILSCCYFLYKIDALLYQGILMNDTLLSVSSFHIEVTYWLLKDSVNLERAFQSGIKKGMVTIVVYLEQTSSKHINKNSWWTCSNI